MQYQNKKYYCGICGKEMNTMRFSDYLPFCIVCEECDKNKVKLIFHKDTLLQILSKKEKNYNNSLYI